MKKLKNDLKYLLEYTQSKLDVLPLLVESLLPSPSPPTLERDRLSFEVWLDC